MENRPGSGGRTVQRHVLYLGEINDAQGAAWCQTIKAFDEDDQQARQIAGSRILQLFEAIDKLIQRGLR